MAPYTAGSPVSSRHCRCPSVSAGPPQGGKCAALGQSSPSSVLTVAVQNRGREDLPSREQTETRTSLHTYVSHTIVHTTRHTDIQTHAHAHTVTDHECEWHTTQVRTTLTDTHSPAVPPSSHRLLVLHESAPLRGELAGCSREGGAAAGWVARVGDVTCSGDIVDRSHGVYLGELHLVQSAAPTQDSSMR